MSGSTRCLRNITWVLAIVVLSFGIPSALGQDKAPPGSVAQKPDQPATKEVAQPAAPAAPEAPAPKAREPYDIRKTKLLTGDWGGVRTSLEDIGIQFRLTYQSQYMVNMHGGLETKNGNDFAGSYDLSLELDFQKMKLIRGGSFFFRAKGTYGGEVTDFDKEKVGGLFRTNDDASIEEPIFVDKWWYRQRFLDDRIEFRLGRICTGKELFDVSKVAGSEDLNFMNQALAANPTIPHKIGLGAYVNVWPVDWLYVRAAVVDPEAIPRRTGFDTAFHGEDRAQALGELGYAPKFETAKGKLPGNYRVGVWYLPGPREQFRDELDGLRAKLYRSDDVGFYTGMEQLVWKESDNPKDSQGATIFARYGCAHSDVNRIEDFWSLGAQYEGLIPTRNKDVLGFGFAQGILSDQYRAQLSPHADRESVYELYYAYELTPWCVITPDFQYITNTGGNKNGPDTAVAGVRVRVSF